MAPKLLNLFLWVLLLILPSGILFDSCSHEGPVEQQKMIKIYTDMLLTQDTSGSSAAIKSAGLNNQVLPDSVKSAIFRKYNVSSKDYEETITFYNENQERWEDFFSKTIDYLDSMKRNPAK